VVGWWDGMDGENFYFGGLGGPLCTVNCVQYGIAPDHVEMSYRCQTFSNFLLEDGSVWIFSICVASWRDVTLDGDVKHRCLASTTHYGNFYVLLRAGCQEPRG
jgi:hypothetical protein